MRLPTLGQRKMSGMVAAKVIALPPSTDLGSIKTKPPALKRRNLEPLKKRIQFLGAILPALVLFGVFGFYPVVTSLQFSLTNYDGITEIWDWVGLSNYSELLTNDSETLNAIKHNLIWAFFFILVQNVIALFLAVLLDQNIKGRNFYRAIFFLPVVISPVAVGFVWSFIYDPLTGSLDATLKGVGLGSWARDWLGNYDLALYSVIVVDLWKNIGFSIVLFLAGLQVVPIELLEAAAIDGASAWRKFRSVTFPLLFPTLGLVLVLSANGALRAFDTVYLMTQGGPGTETQLYMTRLFQEAFVRNRYGYASSMAWLVFAILLLFAWLQLKLSRERDS